MSAIIGAIDWIAENKIGQRAVASMSLGGAGQSSSYVDAIQGLLDVGVVSVVAAGNDNDNACGYSPAWVGAAITVGSTDSRDARSSFSNFGSCVDIMAPGSNILSCGITSNTAAKVASGTSMACPHVSGAAAVAFSNHADLLATGMSQHLVEHGTSGKIPDLPSGTPDILLRV